jgi:FkbM family methyltransferase
MLSTYERPLQLYGRYLLDTGTYPTSVRVRTPAGPLDLTLYSQHDVLTLNEIFCRLDYRASSTDSVFVDFGSNIGISAAYFLSRSPGSSAFAYLFEPLWFNVERLQRNLKPFEGRYQLQTVAVGTQEGVVEFGWENTGRYGGVGRRDTGQAVSVQCLDSNKVLEEIIAKHGRIDVLKIDIEGLEHDVATRIPQALAEHIGHIYTECHFKTNPFTATHTYVQRGSVAQFSRRRP